MPTTSTRRRLLAAGFAVGLGGVAGCVGTTDEANGNETDSEGADSAVETVVSIPGEPVAENMAFDSDGNLLFGITAGELRRVATDQLGSELTLADTELVATLPEAIGVDAASDDTVYVTVPTDDEQAGVWTVPPEGEPAQLAEIGGFPNDILVDDDRNRLLVTESFGGVVYAVGTDGSRTTWLDDDRLDTDGFGANGITRGPDGDLYVAVTQAPNDAGRLLRVPVGEDGSAGEPTVAVESGEIAGADGIDAAGNDVFVAANSQNRVVQVPGEGEPTSVATADDGLVFPSDVVVDPDEEWLYICNFANQSPDEAGILRARP